MDVYRYQFISTNLDLMGALGQVEGTQADLTELCFTGLTGPRARRIRTRSMYVRGFLVALASLSVSWAWIDHSLRPASSSSSCSPAAFLAARLSKPHHQSRCNSPRVSRPGWASRSVQVRRRSHSIISCAEGGGSGEADERLCLAWQVHALSPDGEANLMGLMEQYQHQQQQQEEAERIMKQLEMGGFMGGQEAPLQHVATHTRGCCGACWGGNRCRAVVSSGGPAGWGWHGAQVHAEHGGRGPHRAGAQGSAQGEHRQQ